MRSTSSTSSKLVVVDIENLAGGADMNPATVHHIRHTVTALANLKKGDLVTVASSHHAYPQWAFYWPGCRHLMASGPDGADLALLDVLAEPAAFRVHQIVVASGDGIFAETVARLGAHAHVTVIAPPGSVARRLRMAAAETRYLPAQYLSQEIA